MVVRECKKPKSLMTIEEKNKIRVNMYNKIEVVYKITVDIIERSNVIVFYHVSRNVQFFFLTRLYSAIHHQYEIELKKK